MSRPGRRVLLVAPLALLLLECSAQKNAAPSPAAIPRFRQVVDGFYRGGQPSEEGFRFLKQKGFKTVINLRREHDERAMVERLGMKYVHLPLDGRDEIPEDVIQTFFRAVNDPADRPVFVHCQRGADRTGVMVGFYRIAFQDWDAEKAYDEARALGMRWWYRGLKHQLFEFAARRSARRNRAPGDQRRVNEESDTSDAISF